MSEMHQIERAECLRLLVRTGFGRVAVNTGSEVPVIRPVNYVFDEASQSIIFRTAYGSKFQAMLNSARAAFEIDGVDPATETGWSVIVVGVTERVTNPVELRRLESLGLEPWAPGSKPHWVRVRAGTISGRRIAAQVGARQG